MKRLAVCLLLALLAASSGCSLKATVVDRSGNTLNLEKVGIERGRSVVVWESGKRITVPLRQISAFELYLDETLTHQRELYYMGRVALKDGTRLGSGRMVESRERMTWVRVGDALTGKVGKGSVRITLDRIRTVTFD